MMFTYIDICFVLGLIVLISYVFTSHWLKEISRFSNSSNLLLFYLSTPIDTTRWHARIGMFCILKPLFKSKSNVRKFLAYFTLIYSLKIILFYFNLFFLFFSVVLQLKNQHPIHVY